MGDAVEDLPRGAGGVHRLRPEELLDEPRVVPSSAGPRSKDFENGQTDKLRTVVCKKLLRTLERAH